MSKSKEIRLLNDRLDYYTMEIADICDTDLDFRFNIAALPYLYR